MDHERWHYAPEDRAVKDENGLTVCQVGMGGPHPFRVDEPGEVEDGYMLAAAPAMFEAQVDAVEGVWNLHLLANHLENSGHGEGMVARVREIADNLTAAILGVPRG